MRIAVSGTAGTGKSTVIKDFLAKWPNYKTLDRTYRDIIREKNLGHSKQTGEESQKLILDWLVTEEAKYRKGDKVLFDRCSLDNLIYSLWAHDKGLINKEFIDRSIVQVKESLRNIDIILFIPLISTTKGISQVDISKDIKDQREVDPVYREEIDTLFKAMAAEWTKPVSPFFAKDDKPAFIEIFGTREQRLEIIKMYLDNDGDSIGEGAIINPTEIDRLARELGVKPGGSLIQEVRLKKR